MAAPLSSATPPRGVRIEVDSGPALGSHHDKLNIHSVKGRITVMGTKGPVMFDVTFIRNTPDGKSGDPFKPDQLTALTDKVKAALERMTAEEIDAAAAFRFDFDRTRQDGAEKNPNYEFRTLSRRRMGEATFNPLDTATHANSALLIQAIMDLGRSITQAHDKVLADLEAAEPVERRDDPSSREVDDLDESDDESDDGSGLGLDPSRRERPESKRS